MSFLTQSKHGLRIPCYLFCCSASFVVDLTENLNWQAICFKFKNFEQAGNVGWLYCVTSVNNILGLFCSQLICWDSCTVYTLVLGVDHLYPVRKTEIEMQTTALAVLCWWRQNLGLLTYHFGYHCTGPFAPLRLLNDTLVSPPHIMKGIPENN